MSALAKLTLVGTQTKGLHADEYWTPTGLLYTTYYATRSAAITNAVVSCLRFLELREVFNADNGQGSIWWNTVALT